MKLGSGVFLPALIGVLFFMLIFLPGQKITDSLLKKEFSSHAQECLTYANEQGVMNFSDLDKNAQDKFLKLHPKPTKIKYSVILYSVAISVWFVSFFIFRFIFVANGLARPIIRQMYKNRIKKYIYLGNEDYCMDQEAIRLISFLRRQGLYEDAADEFASLIHVDIDEGIKAIDTWENITGEGIVKNGKVIYSL